MRFLPYSNSFHKIMLKKYIKPLDMVRYMTIVFLFGMLFGLIFQLIKSEIDVNKFKPRNKFVRIDGKKYYYSLTGTGDYTIIMDSSIGVGSYQWQRVRECLKKDGNCKVFTYDRPGYGFSDFVKDKSPEDQARLLKMVLKKAGVYGPFILVGEEYGSLVMTNFANLYGDSVAGMVLVNPINESMLGNRKLIDKYNKDKLLRVIEKNGSYFGVNEVLMHLGLLKNPAGVEEFLTGIDREEFNMLRTKSSYNSVYLDEIKNLVDGKSKSQVKGLMAEKPFALVVASKDFKNEQMELKDLGSEDFTEITTVENEKDVIALENPESVITAIKYTVNKCKKIKQSKEISSLR
jgi:hypothetical protein